MKILLINPPDRHIITTTQAKYVVRERGLVPPLGLLYLAATIKQQTEHDVKLLDCQVHKYSEEVIRQEVLTYQPDVVGISFITFMLIDALAVAKAVKTCEAALGRRICVVAGGPHVTIYPEETARFKTIDFAIAGEAEFAFLEFIRHIDDEATLGMIPGMCYQRNGILTKGPPYALVEDLDSVPLPDRRLLDYKAYSNVLSSSSIMTTMMTSRGCPYQCIFCDRLGKRFRPASAERVLQEIEDCLSLNIQEIFFHDDTFTVHKRRVMEICQLILQRSLKFEFSLRSRVNTIDEEMIAALKRAGCRRISFGVESGVPRILERIRKGITLEQAENAFRLSRKYGIVSLADFMIGHPEERVEDVHATVKFAKKLRPDYVQFSVTTPYPATELYREAIEKGYIERDVWREFARDPSEDFVPPRWEQQIDRETQYALLHQCYRRFYLSPSFLWRNLMKVRSFRELRKKAAAGFKLALHELSAKMGVRKDGLR